MALPATKQSYITVGEYYQLEEAAVERSDYYAGEMYNMAGGSTNHAAIGNNLSYALTASLKGKTCRPFNQDQRIKSDTNDLRIYPDASVFCEPLIYDDEDPQGHTATNPTALFEVLSHSTESYDRGFKFDSFSQTASLQAFVLISQNFPLVEVFTREEQSDKWTLTRARDLDDSIEIPPIGVTLQLADLYDRVEFQSYIIPEENPRR